MPAEAYETDSSDEPVEPNEVRVALSWLFSSEGTLNYEDSQWTVDFDGEDGLEFRDEDSDTIAYISPGTDGDISGGGNGGGAPTDATYVTLDDESSSMENASQHAGLSGDDLHDPADHGSEAHDDTVAELSDQGVLRSSQVPDLAITETYSVADETERLALDVQEGDVAIQEDDDESFIFTGGDASDNSNWSNLLFPEPPIDDVFGRTGSVDAQSGDYTFDQIDDREHDNADHSAAFVADGDDTERQIWVIENGASDPSGAAAEDIIFEEES